MKCLLILADDDLERARLAALFTDSRNSIERLDLRVGLARLRAPGVDAVVVQPGPDVSSGAAFLREARNHGFPGAVVAIVPVEEEPTVEALLEAGATDVVAAEALGGARLRRRVEMAMRLVEAEAIAKSTGASSEELLLQIVNSLPALIAYVDRDHRYVWNNSAYETWFDMPAGAARGRKLREVIGEKAFEVVEPMVERALGGELARFRQELPYPQGARWVDAVYIPHKNAFGEVDGFVVLVLDLSDRAAQTEFEQQLLGIVSHDLRNPISTMMLAAWTLLNRGDLAPDTQKLLSRIMSNGDRAAKMIRDLLDVTRARAGDGITVEPKAMNLHDLAKKVVDEVKVQHAGREVRLILDGDGRGTFDEERIGQTLQNLLGNAFAYGARSAPVTLRILDAGARVRVEVNNDGEPISDAVRATLFQPFKRVNRAHEPHRSLGFGLFLVREIVRAHGGTVDAVSDAASGTTFVMMLPREPKTRSTSEELPPLDDEDDETPRATPSIGVLAEPRHPLAH